MLQVYLNLLDTQEDKEKFEQLYALYSKKMYKVAYQILRNRHDAEDAVHDSVIAIIDNLEKIKKINCHETWSYIVTIVKSRAFNIKCSALNYSNNVTPCFVTVYFLNFF